MLSTGKRGMKTMTILIQSFSYLICISQAVPLEELHGNN